MEITIFTYIGAFAVAYWLVFVLFENVIHVTPLYEILIHYLEQMSWLNQLQQNLFDCNFP